MLKEKLKGSQAFFGLVWALAAPLLLFNPDYTLLDVLPDAVGYLMLVLSLRRMRDLNSYFDAAAERFSKLLVVSGFKFLSFFAVVLLLDGKESPTMTLLLLFCFAIGDLLLAIPAWKAYFDGFAFEGFSYGEKEGKTPLTDRMKTASIVFFIAKEALTLLPEFSVLASHEYIDKGVRWDEFTGLFRTCAIMILSVWGVVWLVRMLRFVVLTMKKTDVLDAAKKKYDETVLVRTGLLKKRRISLLMLLMLIAVIFSTDFLMDGINLLPDYLSGCFCLLFFLLAKDYSPCRRLGIILSAVHIPLSVASWLLSIRFLDEHSLSKVMRLPETWGAFWRYYPFVLCETAVYAAIIVCMLLTCAKIIREHCGYVPESISDTYRSDKLAEIRKALNRRLWTSGILFALAAVGSNLSDLISVYFASRYGDYWWLVSFLLSLLCIWLVYKLGALIRSESNSRYMLA